MTRPFDFAVVGAGMAGASTAAHLAEHARVCLLEMEAQPGHHSTGRSAALFSEAYGNSLIRGLTRASRDFLFDPPADFTDTVLVAPRPVLTTFTDNDERDAVAELHPPGGFEVLTPVRARELCPVLRTDGVAGAVLNGGSADIDVDALHQGYLRLLRRRGGELRLDARVNGLERIGEAWRLQTHAGPVEAGVVVNAAGAWAEELAALAGTAPRGLTPLRRSACLVFPPEGADVAAWPLLKDAGESYYLKPDAGMLLVSPCDETPVNAGDAQPEELDIAVAIDRLERATTLSVRRVTHRWAGLRTFAPDRSPVIGYDSAVSGFFWVAGLGGYGIQTAPALSRFAAAAALGRPADPRLAEFGVNPAGMAPDRPALTSARRRESAPA